MMKSAYDPIETLLPHDRPMILIDRVINFREDYIHASVRIHENSPFLEQGEVPSYVSLEYMAQTVGAWNGLLARQNNTAPKIGFLLGTRQLTLDIPSFKVGDDLEVYGEAKYNDEEMASFECWVEVEKSRVAHAILNVYKPKTVEI